MLLYYTATLIKAIRHIRGMLDMNNFVSLGSIPRFFKGGCCAVTRSLVHFPSLHSAEPCTKYRGAWDFMFCDNLL